MRPVTLILLTFLSLSLPALAETKSSTAKSPIPKDVASDRVVYGPTAIPIDKFSMTAMNLGLWSFKAPINEHLELGGQFTVPFGIFFGGPTIRVMTALDEHFHVALFGNVGFGSVFAASQDNFLTYYGGGPVVTYLDKNVLLNISFLTYGAHWDEGNSSASGVAFLPSIGANFRVNDRTKLNLEVFSLNSPTVSSHAYGAAWAILYGVRILGEQGKMFADIDFMAPITPGGNDVYRYFPLGFPVLMFGFAW